MNKQVLTQVGLRSARVCFCNSVKMAMALRLQNFTGPPTLQLATHSSLHMRSKVRQRLIIKSEMPG